MYDRAVIYEMEEKPRRDSSLSLNTNFRESSNLSDESSTQSVKLLAQFSLPTLVLNRTYFVCNDSYLVSVRSHFNPTVFLRRGTFPVEILSTRERNVFPALRPLRTILYNCFLRTAGDSPLSFAARMKTIIISARINNHDVCPTRQYLCNDIYFVCMTLTLFSLNNTLALILILYGGSFLYVQFLMIVLSYKKKEWRKTYFYLNGSKKTYKFFSNFFKRFFSLINTLTHLYGLKVSKITVWNED